MSEALDICLPVKNRYGFRHRGEWRSLLPHALQSVRQAQEKMPGVTLRVLIADFGSTDVAVERLCHRVLGTAVEYRVAQVRSPFSRGLGLRLAWQLGRAAHIFLVDADMEFSDAVLIRGMEQLSMGVSAFPVFRRYTDPAHTHWVWNTPSFGMAFIPRSMLEQHPGLMPEYTRWGFEDTQFFHRVCALMPVVRYPEPDLCHRWHPDSKKWKNRFGSYPGMNNVFQRMASRSLRLFQRVYYGSYPPLPQQLFEVEPETLEPFYKGSKRNP
jgi:hypothetical protein